MSSLVQASGDIPKWPFQQHTLSRVHYSIIMGGLSQLRRFQIPTLRPSFVTRRVIQESSHGQLILPLIEVPSNSHWFSTCGRKAPQPSEAELGPGGCHRLFHGDKTCRRHPTVVLQPQLSIRTAFPGQSKRHSGNIRSSLLVGGQSLEAVRQNTHPTCQLGSAGTSDPLVQAARLSPLVLKTSSNSRVS